MPRSIGVKARVDRAAIELFAEHGIDGVSIAEIAAAARVSQGALYRHYPSKEALATTLFAAAYRRIGTALADEHAARAGFAARIRAMVGQFCAFYDADAALFRFLLLAQHDLLPRLAEQSDTPAAIIEAAVADAAIAGEIGPVDSAVAAAAIMGIVLQTALFHIYGRVTGALLPRAPALAGAAIAAVAALAAPASS